MGRRLLAAAALAGLLAAPAAPGRAQEAGGREPYDDRHCATCHGADGRGNEGVRAPRLAGMERWYLVRQLENFRSGVRGSGPGDVHGAAMRAAAAPLADGAIAELADWAAGWRGPPAEPTLEGDVQAGRRLYAACAACHGERAGGDEALGAPALAGQNDWYLAAQLESFRAGRRGARPEDVFGRQMAAMARSALGGERDVIDVVSYINTLGR